jgi:hypothetical protein
MWRHTPGRSSEKREEEREERILKLLELELVLLRQILHRLPPPPAYRPTVGIVVIQK